MSVKWYVIRAISGKENKIKTYLEKEIVRNKLEKFVPDVLIPNEKIYVMRDGKKKIKERKEDTAPPDNFIVLVIIHAID